MSRRHARISPQAAAWLKAEIAYVADRDPRRRREARHTNPAGTPELGRLPEDRSRGAYSRDPPPRRLTLCPHDPATRRPAGSGRHPPCAAVGRICAPRPGGGGLRRPSTSRSLRRRRDRLLTPTPSALPGAIPARRHAARPPDSTRASAASSATYSSSLAPWNRLSGIVTANDPTGGPSDTRTGTAMPTESGSFCPLLNA